MSQSLEQSLELQNPVETIHKECDASKLNPGKLLDNSHDGDVSSIADDGNTAVEETTTATQKFFSSVYSLIKNEIEPLAALLADAFSKNNDGDGDGDGDDDKKGSSFLKGIKRIMKEPSFKRMDINTKKPLFKDTKKNILKDTIDIETLDVQFLLKLMKETSFLKLENIKGNCQRHNCETCCHYCDHDQEGKKCKRCETTQSDCGKICCSSCNECLKCQRSNLKQGKDEYMKGNIKMAELKQHCKVCWMFPLKESLETLQKCRNLVHESIKKIKPFFKNENGGSIGEFQNVANLDQLCREIHFAATVLTLVLSKSTLFDEDVVKAKEFEQRIDKLFYYDSSLKLRLVSDPSMEKAYQYFKDNVASLVRDCVKDELTQQGFYGKDAESKDQSQELSAKSITLENVKCNICTLSVKVPIDDSTDFTIKLKTYNRGWKLIANNIDTDTKIKIKKMSCDNGEVTVFILSELELKSGYEYKFLLEIGDSEDKHESNSFVLKGSEETVFSTFGENNIFVVFHNNGLESSCHSFETPENPVNFKKTLIARGDCCPVKNKEEFSEIAQEYMSVNKFEKCFPPEHFIKNENIKCIIKLIPSESSLKKALVGYNYINHLKIYGYTDKDLESFSSSGDHRNTLLFFDEQRSLVVYIRVCEMENASATDIRQEIKMCDEFIRAFLLLHEKSVTSGVLSICAFVALPGTPSKDVEDKIIFVNHHKKVSLFLCQEDFENYNNFKKIIDKSYNLAKNLQKHSGKNSKTNQNNISNKILAESMASMTFTKAFLPRLSRDVHTQVLTLLLNAEQYEAINNPQKKRIIRGPFGSGKSLILQQIIEELISSMKNGTIYYIMFEPYSLLEARMDEVFAELSKTNPSIMLYSSNIHKLLEEAKHSTADNKIETAMKHCLEHSTDDVHFLFDEVDPAYFTEDNAIGLKDFIEKQNDDTTLILAFQCTEKEQKIHKEKTKYDVQFYCQDNNNTTGMTLLRPLSKSMRMVSNVYELKKIAEDVIKPHSTKLALKRDTATNRRRSNSDESVKQSSTTPSKSNQQSKGASSRQNKKPDFKESSKSSSLLEIQNWFVEDFKLTENTSSAVQHDVNNAGRNHISTTDSELNTESIDKTDGNSSSRDRPSSIIMESTPKSASKQSQPTTPQLGMKTSKKVQSPTQLPTDQLPINNRDIFTDNIDQSSQVFETKYSFHKSENGVSIEGSDKPSIIYLDEGLDMKSSKVATILSMIFESEFLVDKSKKTTIICNDWMEAILTLFGLKLSNFKDNEYCQYIPLLMGKGVPSIEEKKSIWEECNSSSNSILVTDFQGFRGCETEICVTFIDPDESYLRHILVEVLARAVTNLIAVILPSKSGVGKSKKKSKNQGNFRQVLNAWVQKDVVDVYKIDIHQNEFSLKRESKNGDVLNEGKFETKNDEDFERFKSTWENRKGNFHQEPRRQFKDSVSKHAPDLVDEALKKLSEHPNENFVVDFVQKKHLGFLIGRLGSTKKKLEEELGIKIIIDNQKGIFKISGPFENKKSAITEIKNVLDKGFWDTLEVEKSKHGIVLKEKIYFEEKFGVKMKVSRDRNSILIQGDIEKGRQVSEEVKALINNEWFPLERYSAGGVAKFIIQNKKLFNFRMRLDKNDGFLYISGSRDKVEQAKAEIDDFLDKERQSFNDNSSKRVVMKFNRSVSQNLVFNDIKEEERYLELCYGINIEINERKILVKGEEPKEKKFIVFLRNTLISKEHFHSGVDEKKAFVLGLGSNQRIKLKRSEYLPKCTVTDDCPPLQLFTSMYHNLTDLKPQFKGALDLLNDEMKSGYGELSLKFHFGKAFYNLQPGSHKIADIERVPYKIKYQRLEKEIIASVLPIEDWNKQKEHCRYDFRIYTPEPYIDIRYKVFLIEDGNGYTVFKDKGVKKAKQMMEIFEKGPGFFTWPEAGIARFDIVEPIKDLVMRLKVKMFKSNDKFEKDVKHHLKYLQEHFFSKLKILPGLYELEFPELSDGYLLGYCRKSVRETYRVPSTDLEVKISNETILINYDQHDTSKEVFDIFVEDVSVTKALDGSRWSPDYIADKYENVFNFGKSILDGL